MTFLLDTTFLRQLMKAYHEPVHDVTQKELLSQKKYYGNIIELILNSKKVYTIDSPSNEVIQQDPLLTHLLNSEVLKPLKRSNLWSEVQEKCYKDFLIVCLSENNDLHLEETPEAAGVFVLRNMNIDKNIFTNYYIAYNVGEEWNWELSKSIFHPHHSMVIADPYLYTKNRKEGLFALLEKLKPIKLKLPYHLTLIGSDNTRNGGQNLFSRETIEKIKIELKGILIRNGASEESIVETFIYNRWEYHDRYLFTNNIAVFPGVGMAMINGAKGKVIKEGTWNSERPFNRVNMVQESDVLFERLMRSKLRIFSNWCKNRSRNRLLKEYLVDNAA